MCERISNYTSEEFENPDYPLIYISQYDEYGLKIFDGGSSYIVIENCPWCGEKLPESKRDRWFNELEKLGFSEFDSENIPDEYRTDKWYKKDASS